MGRVTRKEVEHLAMLSRLELSEEEKTMYESDLADILEHAQKLSGNKELDNAKPMTNVLGLTNVFRKDEPKKEFNRDELLQNAPDTDGEGFRVPKVVE